MKNFLFALFIILFSFKITHIKAFAQADYTLSGYVKDGSNGELLIGSGVYVKELKKGTSTNAYGFYSLTLPEGTYTIVFSFVGYSSVSQKVQLKKNISLNIELQIETQQLDEIVVVSERPDDNITKSEMSMTKIDMKTIKSIPAMVGEIDPIRVIQLLPGVVTASEGSTGFNVRGGAKDQNLVLLDEANVFNPSHLLGFLSVFNNDAIKDMKLYKADIPAQYGGRLSSLLDVRMREGNSKKFSGTGGIGIISSRGTLEGPIVKDKGSFIVSGRRAYVDLFLPLVPEKNVRDATIYFYDVSMKANYTLSAKDKLFISGYFGRDKFGNNKGALSWGNQTLTMRWNHLFSDKLFCNTSLIYSNYTYLLGFNDEKFELNWNNGMKNLTLRSDFSYYWNSNNTLRFGVQITWHIFQPGKFEIDTGRVAASLQVRNSYALEQAIYLSNEQKIGDKLSLEYGLRYSFMQNTGLGTVYHFDEEHNPTDSSDFGSNKNVYTKYFKSYHSYAGWEGLEPRLGVNYVLDEISSIKTSYTRTRQYVHLASNSVTGLPFEIWVPSTPNIKPQYADQFAIGYFRNFFNNQLETSVELYYKNMYNQIDFRDFANLWLNPRLDGEFRFGRAKAYGIEFLFRKQVGKLQGWIGYTYSRVTRYFPEINDGMPYSAPYDKPHNASIVAMYTISPRVLLSANWVYSTGTAITLPFGKYEYSKELIGIVTKRNGYRMPDYHRMDVGLTLKQKYKENRKFFSEWSFSVYNVYNRKNPWMIELKRSDTNPDNVKSTMTYLFGAIPSITWNFRF